MSADTAKLPQNSRNTVCRPIDIQSIHDINTLELHRQQEPTQSKCRYPMQTMNKTWFTKLSADQSDEKAFIIKQTGTMYELFFRDQFGTVIRKYHSENLEELLSALFTTKIIRMDDGSHYELDVSKLDIPADLAGWSIDSPSSFT
jgi:hypothetical protein